MQVRTASRCGIKTFKRQRTLAEIRSRTFKEPMSNLPISTSIQRSVQLEKCAANSLSPPGKTSSKVPLSNLGEFLRSLVPAAMAALLQPSKTTCGKIANKKRSRISLHFLLISDPQNHHCHPLV